MYISEIIFNFCQSFLTFLQTLVENKLLGALLPNLNTPLKTSAINLLQEDNLALVAKKELTAI